VVPSKAGFKLGHFVVNRYKHLNQLSGQTVWKENTLDCEMVFEVRSSSVKDFDLPVSERPLTLDCITCTVTHDINSNWHHVSLYTVYLYMHTIHFVL